MKVKDAHMQAYPFIEPANDDVVKDYHPGMTLRDYFAAKAMQSILDQEHGRLTTTLEFVGNYAYQYADAMLKARK